MITPPYLLFSFLRRVKTPAQIDENNYITKKTVCQEDFLKKYRILLHSFPCAAEPCGRGVNKEGKRYKMAARRKNGVIARSRSRDLRRGNPFSFSGGLGFFCCQRGKPCGFGIVQVICFFVLANLFACRTGTVEDRPRPSCESPPPKARSPPLESTPQRAYRKFSTSLLNEERPVLFGDKRVYRQTARRITGAITMLSGTANFIARSRRFIQQPVSDLSTSSRHGMQRCVLDLCPSLRVIH